MKIEGKNSVRELLRTKKTIDKILIANGMRDEESKNLLNIIKSSGAKYQFADKSVLDKESEGRRHQGFIAYVSDYKYAELGEILASVADKDDAFLVMLDGVEDPHNLGSVIRVCECAGIDGLIIGKRRSASVTDAVMRISEGSANHLKIARVTNLNSALDDSGVNELTRKKCDAHISIPMYGNVNSLNASVACGIGVFEALRQRKDV